MDEVKAEQEVQGEGAFETESLTLHPNGDAVLVVPGRNASPSKEFLVSSGVLSVASDYFKSLFSPDFDEGSKTQRGTCPRIPLEGDDPEAMRVILSILHFQNHTGYEALEPRELAAIAFQSDKYDCARALKPWISVWLAVDGNQKAEDLGLLLSAAYFFRAPGALKQISSLAIRQVGLDIVSSWADQEITSLLPPELTGKRSHQSP
jgi:hypothetical protein